LQELRGTGGGGGPLPSTEQQQAEIRGGGDGATQIWGGKGQHVRCIAGSGCGGRPMLQRRCKETEGRHILRCALPPA